LTLASQSPRRRQLLAEAGYAFDVLPPHEAAEAGRSGRESATELVMRLAGQKAAAVAPLVSEGIVIGCDTVAECNGQILGKPSDRSHARSMLLLLRGRVHHVYSGLCLHRRPDDLRLVRSATTKLKMEALSDQQLEEYLDSNAWQGKAGAFGYQDRLDWLHVLHGSPSNVVGMPLELLAEMLEELERTRGPDQ
jgi:septum formation protein